MGGQPKTPIVTYIVYGLTKEDEEKPSEDTIECADREALVVFTVAELLDEKEVSGPGTFLL
jgi:hypothetical protein